jgi:NitT/TauT family transport system permease protein
MTAADTVAAPAAPSAEDPSGGAASGGPAPARRSPGGSRSRLSLWVPPLVVLGVIIAAWYVVSLVVLGRRNYLLPPPHTVIAESFLDTSILVDILDATWRTSQVALAGLGAAIVIGVVWAIAMSQARWVERSTFPYAVLLQCTPILALVPLIGFWFGYDFLARTIVCVLIALFPMVSNTLFGLQSVDQAHRELFALQGAGRGTVLAKLELPAALPAIFAGMRISAGLSVVGAIVGDFFFQRGTPGIGALLSKYVNRLEGAHLFGAIIAAALLGVVIFGLFGLIAKAAIGRWYDFA